MTTEHSMTVPQKPKIRTTICPNNSTPGCTAATAKSLQSCPTLCNPIGGSPPGYPVPGILQARTLEWVAISFSNAWSEKWKWSHSVMSDSSQPHRLQPTRLYVHGTFQARVLEWGTIAFSDFNAYNFINRNFQGIFSSLYFPILLYQHVEIKLCFQMSIFLWKVYLCRTILNK